MMSVKLKHLKLNIAVSFKSKAEAMRFVNNLPSCEEDNELAIRVKSGKYGDFVCTDWRYFSDNDDFKLAPSIEVKNNIERLF